MYFCQTLAIQNFYEFHIVSTLKPLINTDFASFNSHCKLSTMSVFGQIFSNGMDNQWFCFIVSFLLIFVLLWEGWVPTELDYILSRDCHEQHARRNSWKGPWKSPKGEACVHEDPKNVNLPVGFRHWGPPKCDQNHRNGRGAKASEYLANTRKVKAHSTFAPIFEPIEKHCHELTCDLPRVQGNINFGLTVAV